MEHIEDDAEALNEWSGLLRENGFLLLYVPAHMKSFGLRDRRAGHFRRYEKESLRKFLQNSGFEVVSCGFPLPKLMNKATEILVDKPHLERLEHADEVHKTNVSGIDRAEE